LGVHSSGALADFITFDEAACDDAVFTALVGLASAPHQLDPLHALAAVVAIAAPAGAAVVLNMWYEADIDAVMTRTPMRPIPVARLRQVEALVFGLTLAAGAVLLLALATNLAAAALLAGAIFYRRLHGLARAFDAPQHRHWGCRRRADRCAAAASR
jgi:hypothetical protein